MTEPTPPVFDFPEDKSPSRRTRAAVIALVMMLVVLMVTGVVGVRAGWFPLIGSPAPSEPAAMDYCAATDEGTALRSKLVYTDTRFLTTTPEQSNDDENGRWCVFGPNYDTDLWWVAVYVGEGNSLYGTMIAENGDNDDATRAVLRYQGIPAVKFAREGWVGFLAQDEDGEQWTAFRAGAGGMLLNEIARSAELHTEKSAP